MALRFLQIAADFAHLNPHATIRVKCHQGEAVHRAVQPDWQKFNPSDKTSPHWHTVEDMTSLVAANISHSMKTGNDRTVREFVADFRGLSSSKKTAAVLNSVGLSGASLSALSPDGKLDRSRIAKLLKAMKRESPEIKPQKLGVIGQQNIRQRFLDDGCDPDSFAYVCSKGTIDRLPYVAEFAFGYLPDAETRRIISGCNWSPAFRGTPFDDLGSRNFACRQDRYPFIVGGSRISSDRLL